MKNHVFKRSAITDEINDVRYKDLCDSMDILKQVKENLYKIIMEQREEILKAFIAEVGCKPSECEQVIEYGVTKVTFTVRKKEEE